MRFFHRHTHTPHNTQHTPVFHLLSLSRLRESKRKQRQMSRRGKRKDDDNYTSDGDFDSSNASPKKSAKPNNDDDDDSIVVCEISKNRRVSVRGWQGRVFVDIREYYLKDGKQMPGKKGISLTMDQWKVLREHVDEIDEAVTENS